MIFAKGVTIEEAEEGEVDDASEPEEADSDPQSPNDGLKPVQSRTTRAGIATPLKTRGTNVNKPENRNGSIPYGFQGFDTTITNKFNCDSPADTSNSDTLLMVSQSTQTKLSSEERKTIQNTHKPPIPLFNATPPASILPPLHVQQIPLPPSSVGGIRVGTGGLTRPVWSESASSLTLTGSQQEIEHMHQMYRKACELYDKAVEKINASGLKLPTSLLPRPPAPFMNVTQEISASTGTTISSRAVGGPSIVGILPPPPPPLLTQSLPVIGDQPSNQHLHLTPSMSSTPSALSSDPAYQTAYTSAYQQTMKAIPAPQDGGPTPDTPEFSATWQRYMDHYLRYYLKTNAVFQSTQQPKPQPPPPPPPPPEKELNSATLKENSLPSTLDSSTGMMPSNVADIALPPSPKRSRSGETVGSIAPTNKTEQTAVDHSNSITAEQSGDQSQAASEVTREKEGKSNQPDDLSDSKYVWVSNLPQGVKAVDLKDKCTPFGRVQTIKIIGSRKSKPPSIYAYLIMETPEAAGRLVDGLQGTKLGDNLIKLKRIMALPIP